MGSQDSTTDIITEVVEAPIQRNLMIWEFIEWTVSFLH